MKAEQVSRSTQERTGRVINVAQDILEENLSRLRNFVEKPGNRQAKSYVRLRETHVQQLSDANLSWPWLVSHPSCESILHSLKSMLVWQVTIVGSGAYEGHTHYTASWRHQVLGAILVFRPDYSCGIVQEEPLAIIECQH